MKPIARKIAEELILTEAISKAVVDADHDGTLEGWSCNPSARTVELDGDEDGRIAKRLPKWIKVEKPRTVRSAP